MEIFISRDGQQFGPYPVKQVRELLNQGILQSNDLAYHEGLDNWVSLSDIAGITEVPIIPSLPPQTPQIDLVQTNERSSSLATSTQSSVAPASTGQGRMVLAFVSVLLVLVGLGSIGIWFAFFSEKQSDPDDNKAVLTRAPGALSTAEVETLFADDIGTWKARGFSMASGESPQDENFELIIEWDKQGESTVCKFAPLINGERVPFVGKKKYDPQAGIFIWKCKGRDFPEGTSRERYDAKTKTYHGEATFPDGAKETSTHRIINQNRRYQKSQVVKDGKVVFIREAVLTRVLDNNSNKPGLLGKILAMALPTGSGDMPADASSESMNLEEAHDHSHDHIRPATDSLRKSLIAYYPFNGNARNEAGNDHHGQVFGAKLTADRHGKANSAYHFKLGDHIKIDGLMGKPRNLTLSAWFKLEGPQGRLGSEIISLGDIAVLRADNNSAYAQRNGTGGVFFGGEKFWVHTMAPANYTGTGWHQIVFTFNEDLKKQVTYVDGKQMASKENPKSIVYEGGGTDTFIGVHGKTAKQNWRSQGIIDDLRVYDRALTTAEVEKLFRSEKPAFPLRAGNPIIVTNIADVRSKAEAGDAQAQLSLGLKYIQGSDGLDKDPIETEIWWLRAATQGQLMAQMNLGLLYSRGALGEKDPLKAYQWAKLSFTRGNQKAKELVETLEKELTPEQIADVDAFVKAFKPVPENPGGAPGANTPKTRAEAIKAGLPNYQVLSPNTDPNKIKFDTVNLNRTSVKYQEAWYDGFRFTMPEEGGELVWAFKGQIKSWYIMPLRGRMNGFRSFGYHTLKQDVLPMGKTGDKAILQTLPAENLKAGEEYVIWFSFNRQIPVPLYISLNVFAGDSPGTRVIAEALDKAANLVKEPVEKKEEISTEDITEGKLELIQAKLKAGANPDFIVWPRWKAAGLHVAVNNGQFEIAKLLLMSGAKPNPINWQGKTPLDRLHESNEKKEPAERITQEAFAAMEALLRKHGAKRSAQPNEGEPAKPIKQLTPEEISEALSLRVGTFKVTEKESEKVLETFTGTWVKKGLSTEFRGTGENKFGAIVTYDPVKNLFIENFDNGASIHHSTWNPLTKTLVRRMISPKSDAGESVTMFLKKIGPDKNDIRVEFTRNGELVRKIEAIGTRIEKPAEREQTPEIENGPTTHLSVKDVAKIAAQPHQSIIAADPHFVTSALKEGMWERTSKIKVRENPNQEAQVFEQKLRKKIKHVQAKYVVIENTSEKGVFIGTEVHSYDPHKKIIYSTSVNERGDVTRMIGGPNPNKRTVDWRLVPVKNDPFTMDLSITCSKDGLSAQLMGKRHQNGQLFDTITGVLTRIGDLPEGKKLGTTVSAKPKLTQKQILQFFNEVMLGEWTGVDKDTGEVVEKFTIEWHEKPKSIKMNFTIFEEGKITDQQITSITTYDPKLDLFVEKAAAKNGQPERIKHFRWNPIDQIMTAEVIKPKPEPGTDVKLNWKKTAPNIWNFNIQVFKEGAKIFSQQIIETRKAVPVEK